jgi:hypothetical protein
MIQFPPAGLFVGDHIVDTGSDIDGDTDIDLVTGIHLCPEQIEIQSRVHFPHLCGMITVSVMAAGKTGDRIHMGSLKPFLPQFFIEFFPDPGDQRRRMKVKMHLPEIQFISVHKKIIPCFLDMHTMLLFIQYYTLSKGIFPVNKRRKSAIF